MNTLGLRDPAFLATTLGSACGDPPLLASLQLWFKADAGTLYGGSPAVDGGYIDQWENQGVGTTDALNAVSDATRPILQTGELNGLPIVRFDGSNDYLQLANNADVDIAGDLTFFCVLKPADMSDYHMILTKGITSVNEQWEFRVDAGLTYFNLYSFPNGRYTAGGLSAGNWYRCAVYNDAGSASQAFLNGVAGASGSAIAHASKAAVAYVGKRMDSTPGYGGLWLRGDLAEWGLYNAVLSGAELTALDDYLTCKYGL